MKKRSTLIVTLLFVIAFVFMCGSVQGFAKTKKAKSKSKASARSKARHKTTHHKKTSHRGALSRGSGAVLGEGDAQRVLNYARRFLGVGYRFGHSSPSGFDCSGFTMFVYREAGINLPHSASSQANVGLAVSKDDLAPGDLVFFQTYKQGISHVGIYIGEGKFIHASSGSGYVTISSLSEDYYTARYRGATRILN